MRRRFVSLFLLPVFLCLPHRAASAHEAPQRPDVLRSRRFPLIHPLLDIDYPIEFVELRPFRSRLASLVEGQLAQKRASEVSVYFRDMSNGYWTGIDERAEFTPASLLKVPLMMTVLREAETDPALLGKRLTCRAQDLLEYQVSVDVAPDKKLTAGMTYSIEELLRRMAADSDNGAAVILAGQVTHGALRQTFSDLGVEFSTPGVLSGSLSVKQYGAFFRILYNASYLDKPSSQRALEYLAESTFRRGLAAGVPAGVTVAHKFGERQDVQGRQLHDCGIVYHPDEHYLLCVMTRGSDTAKLAGVIADISRLVYREVTEQHSSRTPAR